MENQLVSVKGIYKDGEIVLLSPFKPIGSFHVVVTFLENVNSDDSGEIIQKINHQETRKEVRNKMGEILNLSDREMEILALVAQGKTNNEISEELLIKNGTIRNYISDMLDKLKADNRTQMTTKARELGLID